MPLTKAELLEAQKLLSEASDIFSNHGCNDHYLTASEANRTLVEAMNKANHDDSGLYFDQKGERLFVADFVMMAYLAKRFGEEAKKLI